MTWRDAFFREADSDYIIFTEFNRARKPACQRLHYLQMATEKLAKAFLCSRKDRPPKPTHAAFVRLLKVIKGRPEIRSKLGYGGNYSAFVSYIDSILDLAERIESLAPEGTRLDRPNPEYPWTTATGDVVCPLDYPFHEILGRPRTPTSLPTLKTLVYGLIRIGRGP